MGILDDVEVLRIVPIGEDVVALRTVELDEAKLGLLPREAVCRNRVASRAPVAVFGAEIPHLEELRVVVVEHRLAGDLDAWKVRPR